MGDFVARTLEQLSPGDEFISSDATDVRVGVVEQEKRAELVAVCFDDVEALYWMSKDKEVVVVA